MFNKVHWSASICSTSLKIPMKDLPSKKWSKIRKIQMDMGILQKPPVDVFSYSQEFSNEIHIHPIAKKYLLIKNIVGATLRMSKNRLSAQACWIPVLQLSLRFSGYSHIKWQHCWISTAFRYVEIHWALPDIHNNHPVSSFKLFYISLVDT